jgi:hypothetical protein
VKKKQVREVSPECRAEINRPRKISATYRQGRVVAPTVEEALARIREKFPGLERVAVFACPVQPWPEGIWWEWLGKDGKACSLKSNRMPIVFPLPVRDICTSEPRRRRKSGP